MHGGVKRGRGEDEAYTHERERNRKGGLRGENTSALDRRIECNMYI